jgi:hypothetical protein
MNDYQQQAVFVPPTAAETAAMNARALAHLIWVRQQQAAINKPGVKPWRRFGAEQQARNQAAADAQDRRREAAEREAAERDRAAAELRQQQTERIRAQSRAAAEAIAAIRDAVDKLIGIGR